VNWSDRDYAPLEAEIEAERSGRLRPKLVTNLVKAVRRDRQSATFVVIGNPGSGKSVSLRNLVRGLVSEAERSGVVPIYVNLREFPVDREVNVGELVAFAHESVREQTGRDGEAFLSGWYERFRIAGRLFFVFDSFDELPQVLDADDQSETHTNICREFDRLFTQEARSCRKLLASRPFRAPSGVQGTRLLIRQLTEAQVRQIVAARVLGRGFDAAEFVRKVFRDRPELIPILRNPFTAELLTDFARERNGELPESTFGIFDTYVRSRLKADEPRFLERLGLTADELRNAAQTLALALFEGGNGLEGDSSWAASVLDTSSEGRGQKLIEGLKYTRLVRVGGQQRVMLTFAHRRFAEFFAVSAILSVGRTPPVDDIPTDSRWRDGLVMYCGVAPDFERRRVAEYCWDRIRCKSTLLTTGKVSETGDAIHCLRFLVDAFRTSPREVVGFRLELGQLIRKMLQSAEPLVAKLAAEAIPLADDSGQQRALFRAMASNFTWVQETAINSCRNLPALRQDTSKLVRVYYRTMPTMGKIRRLKDLDFTLGLSEAFRTIRLALWGDVVEMAAIVLLSLGLFIYISVTMPSILLILFIYPIAFYVTQIVVYPNSSVVRFVGAIAFSAHLRRFQRSLGVTADGKNHAAAGPENSDGKQTRRQIATDVIRARAFGRFRRFILIKLMSDKARVAFLLFGINAVLVSAIGPYTTGAPKAPVDVVGAYSFALDLHGIAQSLTGGVTGTSSNLAAGMSHNFERTRHASLVGLMPSVLLVMFAFFGWENLLVALGKIWSPSNWANTLAAIIKGRAIILRMIRTLVVMFGVGAVILSVAVILILYGMAIIVVYAVFLAVVFIGILLAYAFAQMAWVRFLDRKVLMRGTPDRVTPEQVISVLLELRSSSSRREYLQSLLSRRVPVAMPAASSADILASRKTATRFVFERDPGAAEDWGKLQEFWLGLSR
jgi:NACHT domain